MKRRPGRRIFAVAPALLPLLVASAGVAALGSAIWMQGARRGHYTSTTK